MRRLRTKIAQWLYNIAGSIRGDNDYMCIVKVNIDDDILITGTQTSFNNKRFDVRSTIELTNYEY